ncbi:YnfC family lipoprotein [Pluralibacter gergoviae]|uniref:YnfC family lipoprotein n=1 Tax=Pluralibacter gergoviae TaxID=61647 RepID=UPI0009006F4F|nr:YnfC family lipoprotein [Pluralibacter gergoviae]
MKPLILFSAISCFFLSAHAAAVVQFKPAVLNASLLFNYDPVLGDVKSSLQWIRSSDGSLIAVVDITYDRNGCFTSIDISKKVSSEGIHIENKNGVISSVKKKDSKEKTLNITGKVNSRCEITELNDDTGSYLLSYNVRGLLETVTDRRNGVLKERYEYGHGKFPIRYKNYKDNKERRYHYPQPSEQFLDWDVAFSSSKYAFWQKISCSYGDEGNAEQCIMITAYDPNYRKSPIVWYSGHRNYYYK